MHIHIDDSRSLKQIQDEFSSQFPLLKLEFFRHSHGKGGASSKDEMLDSSTSLNSLMAAKGEVKELRIKGDMTVAEVETAFREHFGLNVQVFRLSGRTWLETTVTDSWTLSEQSRQAAILQHPAEP